MSQLPLEMRGAPRTRATADRPTPEPNLQLLSCKRARAPPSSAVLETGDVVPDTGQPDPNKNRHDDHGKAKTPIADQVINKHADRGMEGGRRRERLKNGRAPRPPIWPAKDHPRKPRAPSCGVFPAPLLCGPGLRLRGAGARPLWARLPGGALGGGAAAEPCRGWGRAPGRPAVVDVATPSAPDRRCSAWTFGATRVPPAPYGAGTRCAGAAGLWLRRPFCPTAAMGRGPRRVATSRASWCSFLRSPRCAERGRALGRAL